MVKATARLVRCLLGTLGETRRERAERSHLLEGNREHARDDRSARGLCMWRSEGGDDR